MICVPLNRDVSSYQILLLSTYEHPLLVAGERGEELSPVSTQPVEYIAVSEAIEKYVPLHLTGISFSVSNSSAEHMSSVILLGFFIFKTERCFFCPVCFFFEG